MTNPTETISTDNSIQESEEKKVISSQPTNVKTEPEVAEKPEDPNWRAFREARKKDRIEKENAERRAQEKEAEIAALKAAMEAAFSNAPQATSSTSYIDESEEEKIEKKIAAALEKREEQYRRERAEQEKREYPNKLNQMYNDFSRIVCEENLDYLEYHYPEVAGPLKRLPDGFDKWNDIYRAVKKFVPGSMEAQRDAARAQANLQKPKSMSVTGVNNAVDSSAAFRLSEDRKQANWERMQRTLKGLS